MYNGLNAEAECFSAKLESEAKMAVIVQNVVRSPAGTTIPRALRQKVDAILDETLAFMDSPMFHRKDAEQ